MTASQIHDATASPESSQEKQVEAMHSRSYRVLLIAEDPSRTQAYIQMLQDAEDISFEVETKTNWPSALSQFVSSAPDWPRPDAILWELSASTNLAFLKDATSLQSCVPFVLLVPEGQEQLRKQVLEAGAGECLVGEKLSQELLQMALRHAIDRRQLENMVRQSQNLEAIGRLSGGLAHEFNNLLCVIKGHTELLTEALHPADPAIRSVAQIRKAAETAAALTRQLLAFSRRHVSLPQVVDLDGIVRPSPIDKGNETILVVEDAQPLRALTKEFLTASGYTVLEAPNGEEAIEVARSYRGSIDLLLTDVVMPRMGGKPLVEQMAQIRPHTRVLYMSGYPNDGIVQAGVVTNGVLLLEKPFTREILSQRVRQALDEVPQSPRNLSGIGEASISNCCED